MNRLHITFLALLLLLGQWGSFDHLHHAHDSGEVCDYCLQAQGLDHAVVPVTQHIAVKFSHQSQPAQVYASTSDSPLRYYSVRAPPRSI